jgi:hypothetical protein
MHHLQSEGDTTLQSPSQVLSRHKQSQRPDFRIYGLNTAEYKRFSFRDLSYVPVIENVEKFSRLPSLCLHQYKYRSPSKASVVYTLQSGCRLTPTSPQASALEEPDMLSEVLSRLDLVELVRAGSVCKAWHSISGADNKALWRALAQRGVAWEAEEGRQPGAWLPHEQPQFPPTVGEYEWMPTARFEHMRRSNVMELMRNSALRAQVAGEAVTQRAADPSSPKEAVMASGLR